WDCYVFSDLVTYPSLYEGWGNQFLEALRARVPIVVFEYPVYRADIKEKGFSVISLGSEVEGKHDLGLVQVSNYRIEHAARESLQALTDSALREAMVKKNFALGKRLYSLESLERYLHVIMHNG
ncbi:glycosyltransferase, partial [Candidatus Bipolaricaulota bacterium]|nr:glycosyltransferase [Candidatus Bipolaricaulota bacterium]